MRELMLVLALAAAALPATAQTVQKSDGVSDTSSVEADGDKVIQLSTIVPAPPARVWEALTTPDGWRRLGVQSAAVDFRVGGMIETNYRPNIPAGEPGNIKNEIVAYVPGRLLAMRNVQAPPGFAHAEEFSKTATVLELAPAEGGTRLTPAVYQVPLSIG